MTTEWIDVKDKLPNHGQEVICWVCPHVMFGADWRASIKRFNMDRNGNWFGGWSMDGGYVTHWMPLPDPPKPDDT